MNGLMTHSGAFRVGREELKMYAVPDGTKTWRPVPHYDVATRVVDYAAEHGYGVTREEYAVARDGAVLFGVVQFESAEGGIAGTGRMIGLRHANDKSMALSIAAGCRVFVCDNMAFGGEIVLKHKHTSGLELDALLPAMFSVLPDKFGAFNDAVRALMDAEIGKTDARSAVIDMASEGAIASCDILPVLNEFEHPRCEEFARPTKWSLYNAFTSVGKKFPAQKFDRMTRLLTPAFGLGTASAV